MPESDLVLLTSREVAEKLKISERFAYQLIQRGEIPHLRIGRSVRVRPEDLVQFVDSRIEGNKNGHQ